MHITTLRDGEVITSSGTSQETFSIHYILAFIHYGKWYPDYLERLYRGIDGQDVGLICDLIWELLNASWLRHSVDDLYRP